MLLYHPEKVCRIVQACGVLHNIAHRHGVPLHENPLSRLPLRSTKRMLKVSSSTESNGDCQPAQKRQRRDPDLAVPKTALTTISSRRPLAATAKPAGSKAVQPMGAATAAGVPSRGVLRQNVAAVALKGRAKQLAASSTAPKPDVGGAAAVGWRRPGWDMRGKVSNMQAKLQSYQSRVKTAHQDNEELRSSVASIQMREEEMGKELETQRIQIRRSQMVRKALDKTVSERTALQTELTTVQRELILKMNALHERIIYGLVWIGVVYLLLC
ncbi:hypothetical protein N1851_033495 [Merluccius polli]|uniref:Uncharacterized protein n=1 Tax=Merluccius polli TaxID=89951 RepID=A0AA47NNI7_MERPO|nr:hypothetical protein N1851_033495 [Merluccius polli]